MMTTEAAMRGMYLSGVADAYESVVDEMGRLQGDKLKRFCRELADKARADAELETGVSVKPFREVVP